MKSRWGCALGLAATLAACSTTASDETADGDDGESVGAIGGTGVQDASSRMFRGVARMTDSGQSGDRGVGVFVGPRFFLTTPYALVGANERGTYGDLYKVTTSEVIGGFLDQHRTALKRIYFVQNYRGLDAQVIGADVARIHFQRDSEKGPNLPALVLIELTANIDGFSKPSEIRWRSSAITATSWLTDSQQEKTGTIVGYGCGGAQNSGTPLRFSSVALKLQNASLQELWASETDTLRTYGCDVGAPLFADANGDGRNEVVALSFGDSLLNGKTQINAFRQLTVDDHRWIYRIRDDGFTGNAFKVVDE